MRTALLAALLLPSPLLAQATEQTCSWYRVRPEAFYEGPCTVEFTSEGARITAGNIHFTIREERRQGQWTTLRLDGRPAVRYEIDRTRYSYATLDLNEFLDIGP